MRDLEEDEEMRAGINLYKRPPRVADPDRMDVESEAGESVVTGADDEEYPKSASRTL